MGSPISAKSGDASWDGTPVNDVISLQFTGTNATQPYNSSDTAGETKRVAGHNDSTLTLEYLPDAGTMVSVFTQGQIAALIGYSDQPNSKSITGSFIVDSVQMSVPIGDGSIVGDSVSLSQASGPHSYA